MPSQFTAFNRKKLRKRGHDPKKIRLHVPQAKEEEKYRLSFKKRRNNDLTNAYGMRHIANLTF